MELKALFLSVVLLIGLTAAAPICDDDYITLNVTKEFFVDEFIVYKSDHDIVNLLVPINGVNMEADDFEVPIIFYTLADISENGEETEIGIYKLENSVATVILDEGRDSAADLDDEGSKLVYLGGKDGIYVYDHANNTTKKFGTITDSIKRLVKVNGTDKLYVLTDDKCVYEILDQGTKKLKYDAANGATDIVLDVNNKLYFVKDSKVYVYDGETKEIDIPIEGDKKLIRPPFLLEDAVLCLVGDDLYAAYSNGTSELVKITVIEKPTAYSIDSTLLQYYAYDKKIYQYNILQLFFEHVADEMKTLLDAFKTELEEASNNKKLEIKENSLKNNNHL